MWPSQTPSGSAITSAIASASADTPSWCSVSVHSSAEVVADERERVDEVVHVAASPRPTA